MSTFDSAAVWSATPLALDDTKIGAAGLSVRQRKLLSALAQSASLSQLALRIAHPIADVQTALERLAKLGFVQSRAQMQPSPMVTRLRSPGQAIAPSHTPLILGATVAIVALVGAGVWLLRSGSASAPSAPVASSVIDKARERTLPDPGDNANSSPPGSALKTAAVAVPVAVPVATANPVIAAPDRAVIAPPAKAAVTAIIAPVAASLATLPTPSAIAPAPTLSALATELPVAPTTPTATAPTVTTAAQAAAVPTIAAPLALVLSPQVATATPIIADAATAARPVATSANARDIKLVNRIEPLFPRGYDTDKGTVRARLQVDARGAVTGVDIVEANPPRVFDRTVRTALLQWRYEPTGEAFSVIAEINFSR